MMIKDLEVSKELGRNALSAVRGGNTIIQTSDQDVYNKAESGDFFSGPAIAVAHTESDQSAFIVDNDEYNELNLAVLSPLAVVG